MSGLGRGRDELFARVVRWARLVAGALVLLMPLRDVQPPPGAPPLLAAALTFTAMMLALDAWSLWRSRRGDHSPRRQLVESSAELVAALITAAALNHLAIFEVTPGYLVVASMFAGLRLGLRRALLLVVPATVVLVATRALRFPSWGVPPGVDSTDLGLLVPPVVALLVLTVVVGLAIDSMRAAEVRADAARVDVEDSNTALRRTNDALERFARTIAHDLRAPLSATVGFAELVRDRGSQLTPDQLHQVTDTLAHSARRASELVTDMLEGAQGEGRRELVATDLRAWLLALLGPVLAEHGGTLTVEADAPSYAIAAGPVRALLLNLVTNAVKHHDPSTGPATVAVSLARRDDELRISVDDDGPGIPRDLREAVLRHGVRGETVDTTGSGHGLAEVHRMLHDELDGDIRIDDGPLGGTRVLVTLPLVGHRTPA